MRSVLICPSCLDLRLPPAAFEDVFPAREIRAVRVVIDPGVTRATEQDQDEADENSGEHATVLHALLRSESSVAGMGIASCCRPCTAARIWRFVMTMSWSSFCSTHRMS